MIGKSMPYIIAFAAAAFLACLIYLGHWAVQAKLTKIKSDLGVPADTDVAIKVPKAWETVLEIEAFTFHFRLLLVLIVLGGGLVMATLWGRSPQSHSR
jgi:hypothetical protein